MVICFVSRVRYRQQTGNWTRDRAPIKVPTVGHKSVKLQVIELGLCLKLVASPHIPPLLPCLPHTCLITRTSRFRTIYASQLQLHSSFNIRWYVLVTNTRPCFRIVRWGLQSTMPETTMARHRHAVVSTHNICQIDFNV